eukprot:TRINITY_DN898_c0_g2_i4.p3 TRINITY_DN898_c0_g2~~TRINITY_DN898_c0_g2_i4.p3  ORF type:complete len:213 (+),score=36.40 TRINITY_DN898_c0_g2_i4:633-1271(+)
MLRIVCLTVCLFAYVNSQGAAADAIAAGAIPGGSGYARGQGVGANVAANAVVELTPSTSFSSATVVATGGAPKPKPKPAPKPTPRKVVPVPKKVTCHDIKDDYCPLIDEYDKCAFCLLDYYPLKGYGVEYYKRSYYRGKKLVEEYVVSKECKGKLIYKGKDCGRGCDYYDKCVKGCKDTKYVTNKKGQTELRLTRSCLKKCDVDDKILKKCF